MILSISRRTDIPAFYSKCFMNRIKKWYNWGQFVVAIFAS